MQPSEILPSDMLEQAKPHEARRKTLYLDKSHVIMPRLMEIHHRMVSIICVCRFRCLPL